MAVRDLFERPDIPQRQSAEKQFAEKASESSAGSDQAGLQRTDPRPDVAYGSGAQAEDVLVSAEPEQTVTYDFGRGADDKEPTPSVPEPEQDHGVVAEPQDGIVIAELPPPETSDETVSDFGEIELAHPDTDDTGDDGGG